MTRFISVMTNGLLALSLAGCASPPKPPQTLNGSAQLVMGFTTDESRPYEGGTLYTGLRIESINGQSVGNVPLSRYDTRLIPPGRTSVDGYCFWRLRSISWNAPSDLKEPAHLEWKAEPNHVYTLYVNIDEYKATCNLSYYDRALPGAGMVPQKPE